MNWIYLLNAFTIDKNVRRVFNGLVFSSLIRKENRGWVFDSEVKPLVCWFCCFRTWSAIFKFSQIFLNVSLFMMSVCTKPKHSSDKAMRDDMPQLPQREFYWYVFVRILLSLWVRFTRRKENLMLNFLIWSTSSTHLVPHGLLYTASTTGTYESKFTINQHRTGQESCSYSTQSTSRSQNF